MLLTNVWYIAELSENLTDKPVKARMLARDFVLYRDQHGKAACLSNTCCHRGASLSQGKCQDDGTVSCPFHGWRFDAHGRCTTIPSAADPQGNIPAAARVDSYPTVEKHGFIWVFRGTSRGGAARCSRCRRTRTRRRKVTHSDTWRPTSTGEDGGPRPGAPAYRPRIPLNERESEPPVGPVQSRDRQRLPYPPRPPAAATRRVGGLRTERTIVNSRLTF